MHQLAAIAAALLLSSCTYRVADTTPRDPTVGHPPNHIQRVIMSQTELVWNLLGLDEIGEDCDYQLQELRISTRHKDLERFCGAGRQFLQGCYDGENIYLGGNKDSRELLIHEYLHALGQCTGRGANGTHDDFAMWGKGGVLDLTMKFSAGVKYP